MSNLIELQTRVLLIDTECARLHQEKQHLLKQVEECEVFVDDGILLPAVQQWITRVDNLATPTNEYKEGFYVVFTNIPKCLTPFLDIHWKSLRVPNKSEIEPTTAELQAIHKLGIKIQFNWTLDDKKRKLGMTTTEYANKRRDMIFKGMIEPLPTTKINEW